MTIYSYYTDYALLAKDRNNCWRVIHPKCDAYMQEKGNQKAEELFYKLVNAALKAKTTWTCRLSEEDKQRLNNCVKIFVTEAQRRMAKKIFHACAEMVRGMDEDKVRNVIDKIGDMDGLFKLVCADLKEQCRGLVNVYASLWYYAYQEKGELEVSDMLLALPCDMLKVIYKRVSDRWEYSLSVRNGRLVVDNYLY